MTFKRNFPLQKITSIRVGGPAKYFAVAKSEKELAVTLALAKQKGLKWYILGEGSNMVVSDSGYSGVIIQNAIADFTVRNQLVTVGAGHNLLKFINKLNSKGLSGLERMAGIPGTVGGAVYGCAGAYGQEIKDNLVSVRFYDGKKFRTLTRSECRFGYRSSIFKKHKNWVITGATFRLSTHNPKALRKISEDTIKLRSKKYKPGLACPGSFFKNLLASKVKVPRELQKSVVYGKLPAGTLLEQVGAKGMKQGKIAVAAHHANLIYNMGGGTAQDIKKLSTRLKALVKKKFAIIIDEEVQYL